MVLHNFFKGLPCHGAIDHQRRRPIGGTFEPAGNKNAILPMLAACLLTTRKLSA